MRGIADAVLRGIAQVMLQNNSRTGLAFLIGIGWNAPLLALAAVVGTLASTAAAMLLRIDRAQVRAGLYGFNGCLTAIAVLMFLQPSSLAWIAMLAASAASTVMAAALNRLLARWSLTGLTAPFVLASWCVLLALPELKLPAAAATTSPAAVERIATVAVGTLNGVGQVFLQHNIVTAVLLTLGLFISSVRVGMLALAGSLLGLLVSWGLGTSEAALQAGLGGFNSVLVAIALGGSFTAPGCAATAYALVAAAGTPLMSAAVSVALQAQALPGLTLPFVLVTWLFLLVDRMFPALSPAPGSRP